MTWEEYRDRTHPMDRGPYSVWYMALGLAGETGEVVDEIKKGYRPGWDINPGKLLLEMGDVLWYWTRMCEHFGWSFEDVARANIDKLTKRRAAGGYVG